LHILWLAGLAFAMVVLTSGCRSKECARMMTCCQAIKDVDGVGNTCGSRASSVEDPATCQTILETVGHMFEEKEAELPEACDYGDSGD
jgi:hypothetical protein